VLCLLFNELGLYVLGFSETMHYIVPASSVIPMPARTRGPGALEPSSSGLSQI